MKTFFDQLNQKYNESFVNFPWQDEYHLASWSAQTHYFTKHITRIMAMCSANCKFEYEELHKFFIEHLREEFGHHIIAQKDVEKLGYSLESFPELPSTRLLYEPQYFKALQNPISFYGFGLMLEWLAVSIGTTVYNKVKDAGLESNFLKVHIKEDGEHSEKAEMLVKKFQKENVEEIKKNCLQTFVAYDLMLKEISYSVNLKKSKKVA